MPSEMPKNGIVFATHICHGYEGLSGLGPKGRYYPYHVKADRPGLLTLGRGHLLSDAELKHGVRINGKLKLPNDGLTLDEVDQLFAQDVHDRVAECWKAIGQRGNEHQSGAMLSLFFNCPAAFSGSSTPTPNDDTTPLRHYLAGDMLKCAEGILLYTKSNGQHQHGLFRRRGTEALLLKTGTLHIAKTDATQVQLEQLLKHAGIKYKDRPEFH